MEKFLILNQDNVPQTTTRWNEFTCGILELGGAFVVRVATTHDGHSYACGIYHEIEDAAKAVAELKNFALKVSEENRAFLFPVPTEPVTALEVVEGIDLTCCKP